MNGRPVGIGANMRALGRRTLLRGTAAAGVALGLSAATTQFIAWRLHYNPALGTPWAGHFYAPWVWLSWLRAPWAAGVHRVFATAEAGVMAAGMLALACGFALSAAGRRRPKRHEGIHGTARFQSEGEIRAGELLPAKGKPGAGVYVGGWSDAKEEVHYLRHDGPEHCIIIAPTRSGKGVGNIVPTLLSWPAAALIYDEKGELWQLTAGWRAQHTGNRVIRWEPGAATGSAGFNFLAEVRLGTRHEVADAQSIAQMICDPHGEGIEGKDHWGKTSFDLLSAVILHALYTHRKNKVACLADVAAALSNPNEKSDVLWEAMRSNRHLDGEPQPAVAAAGRDMLDRQEKERGSVLSSAKTYLTLARDPIVADNTRHSDFRLADLMDGEQPASLYIVTRGADKERLRPLVRLLLTMALRQGMGVPLTFKDNHPVLPHKHRMLLLLDEFPSLGKLQIVQDALPKCAGYGIKALLAAQNRQQLFATYGKDQSITGNCHIRIIYTPNEFETAEWLSGLIGTTTVVTEEISEAGTRYGTLRNVTRSYREHTRPLMTPDEIMALRKPRIGAKGELIEPGEMIIFASGGRPIRGTPILYYRDPAFHARAAISLPETTPSASAVLEAAQ